MYWCLLRSSNMTENMDVAVRKKASMDGRESLRTAEDKGKI